MLFLLLIVVVIVVIVLYLKSFYTARAEREKKAEEHRRQHGGSVLVWDGPLAGGAADAEFGALVVEIPKKRGDGAARFYETGLVLENKRLPYSEIKDIVLVHATKEKAFTPKQAARDLGTLWIYRKKGSAIGLRGMTYRFDNEIMERIKQGLGF